MATWEQLRSYVYAQYEVFYVTPAGQLSMKFKLPSGRSQMVLISRAVDGSNGDEWAKIESIVGRIDEVNLAAALEQIRFQVVGGLAKNDEFVTVRHSIPLAEMNVDDFEMPLAAVIDTADYMEQLTGTSKDQY